MGIPALLSSFSFSLAKSALSSQLTQTSFQLHWRRLSSLKVTFAELQRIVTTNDKQRFVLEPNPSPNVPAQSGQTTSTANPSRWRIRASQGHSLTTLSNSALYMKILPTDIDCPTLLVHGTYEKPWLEIKKSGGLKAMGRTLIHFADRLPKPLPQLDPVYQSKSKPKEEGPDKLISGMRPGATIVIWVEVRKSMQAGVEWWRSQNSVFLTKGLEREGLNGKEWVLGSEFFKWAERRRETGDGEILYGAKVPSVGKPEEADGVESHLGALSVSGDHSAQQKVREGKDKGAAVVKESWDDGDD